MIIKRKRSILDATMIRKDNGMTDLLYEGWEDELTQEYSPNEDDLGNEASSTREDRDGE